MSPMYFFFFKYIFSIMGVLLHVGAITAQLVVTVYQFKYMPVI